jgi:hypothetical protein
MGAQGSKFSVGRTGDTQNLRAIMLIRKSSFYSALMPPYRSLLDSNDPEKPANAARGSAAFRLAFAIFCVGILSFVWFYPHPLSCDMPMHTATAKAYLDLFFSDPGAGYPYVKNVQISSYALAEIILAIPIGTLGVLIGTKVALSAYCILFALSIYYFFGQVSSACRWARLAGFPLTLNYFFHYGFWPYMLGLCSAIFAMGVTLAYRPNGRLSIMHPLLRLITFALHPVAAIPVAIFDVVVIFYDQSAKHSWYHYRCWRWREAFWYWSLTGVFLALMLLTNKGGYSHSMVWLDLWHQLTQLFRPLFISKDLKELAIPAIFAFLVFFKGRHALFNNSYWPIFVAGILIIAIGMIIPRLEFLGSFEQGVRVTFIGWIILFSIWSACDAASGKYVVAWLLVSFTSSLWFSHTFWHRHEPSFDRGLQVFAERFAGASVVRYEDMSMPGHPSIPLGAHLDLWAWSLGLIGDAHNAAAAWNFGPVKYVGVDQTKGKLDRGLLFYHPYAVDPEPSWSYSEKFMDEDSIYTLFRL